MKSYTGSVIITTEELEMFPDVVEHTKETTKRELTEELKNKEGDLTRFGKIDYDFSYNPLKSSSYNKRLGFPDGVIFYRIYDANFILW